MAKGRVKADNNNLREDLEKKIKVLAEVVWDNKCDWSTITDWLRQFNGSSERPADEEQLYMLHLLSNFIYFGSREVRELLRAVYRDLFQYNVVAEIRRTHNGLGDRTRLARLFAHELRQTRFVPLGTPAESSSRLLYDFRTVNDLPTTLFPNPGDLVATAEGLLARKKPVRRVVFLDDLCGSGDQATKHAGPLIRNWRARGATFHCSYYVLIASHCGLQHVDNLRLFDCVAPVFELNDDFKAFSDTSLVFATDGNQFSRDQSRQIAEFYGKTLRPKMPLGRKNAQLMLAFDYNTPNNTLPIFWFDGPKRKPWVPLFRRYTKK